MVDTIAAEPLGIMTSGEGTGTIAQDLQQHGYNRTGDVIKASMANLVKGAGYVTGNAPLGNQVQITERASQATMDLRVATRRGYTNKSSVVGGMNKKFLDDHGYLKTALTTPSMYEPLAELFKGVGMEGALQKSFTAGNMGIGSIYGLAPFDLRAPSRLIYPMYTVLRNKFPRPAGQGLSMQEHTFTGISGSGTGGQGVL